MDKISAKHVVILVGLMNLGFFVFYADTIKQLFDFWSESYGYSHGIILFPIALGIYFFELYKNPKLNTSCINIYSVLLLSGMACAWFLADLLNIQFIEFLVFLAILILLNLVLTTDKLKNTSHLWPLLLIVFTLPIWDFLSDILRTIETPVVVLLLKMSFIETIQDGFLVYIPAGTFLVEGGCSGFNQFIVSVPLATLYIYSRNLKFVASYKFVGLLLLLAIIFNILRIYIIIVAGHISHMKSSLLHDHEYLAWIIYGTGVFILFYVMDKRLNKVDTQKNEKSQIKSHDISLNKIQLRTPLILIGFTLLLGPLLSISYSVFKNKTLINIEQLTENLYWKENDRTVKFTPAYAKGDVLYARDMENLFGQSVNLYLNHFVNQEQGREAINGVNSLISSSEGIVTKLGKQIIKLPELDELSLNESIVKLKSGEQYIAWQWYFTNGIHTGKGFDARLNNIFAIFKNKPAITNIVVSKKIQSEINQTRKILELFILDNISVISDNLNQNLRVTNNLTEK